LLNWWNLLRCIGGDFCITCFLNERSGEACFSLAMMEFYNFIFEQGLMDLPLVGRTFTWSNNQVSPSWSRIDRFLVS
jgi:hypothetical protein